jgi:hypothetical protein
MAKKLGLIFIHGMGETKPDFADHLEQVLRQQLDSEIWKDIHRESVFYQSILQVNQRRVWNDMQFFPSNKLRWSELRKFMIYGFSDASSLEHRNTDNNSVYKQTQKIIVDSLRKARKNLENQESPLIVIAQSLGGQVISNYIWDSQMAKGVWDLDSPDYINPSIEEKDFISLKTMRFLLTTGCNIPLFVAGFDKIVPFDKSKLHSQFEWKNYYDRDDVLGWPLQPLSDEYNQLVEDIEINSGNFLLSQTPFSHNEYWTDPDFCKPLFNEIKRLLNS